MRLREEPRAEDLEVITYWVKENRQAWPTNENNEPLRKDGEPFIFDENGVIGLPKPIDPQEREEFDSEPTATDLDHDQPERLIFKLKLLLGRDHNKITQAIVKTQTRNVRRRRRNLPTIDTEINLALACNLKLKAAIVEWEGIEDEDGNPAEITLENIDILPAWIQTDLVDHITTMSLIGEDEMGE